MASCETCQYAAIDEFTGEAFCDLDLDEDEVIRLSTAEAKSVRSIKTVTSIRL